MRAAELPDTALTPALRLTGIRKRFGAVVANADANLEVTPGEIHALVGENGAGKSTLMRILAGVLMPDAGTVQVNGVDVTGWSASEAISAGVGMVYQHFMLVPPLTVAENVVLGLEPRRGGLFDRESAVREVSELARRTGLRVAADVPLSSLSVGEAQRVEILKVLYRGARILVLDEPTAVLSPPEVEELWTVLRGLREEGGTAVVITHRLDEVMAISDRVTVMRAGRTVLRTRTADTSPAELARAMVGREVSLAGAVALGGDVDVVGGERGAPPNSTVPPAPPLPTTTPARTGASARSTPALELRSITVSSSRRARAVDSLSLSIAPGEIVGIAGVEGNGQTELIHAIAGLATLSEGSIHLEGRDISGLSVRERGDAGLSHIPEDRQQRGLILDFSVADNLVLGQQHHYARSSGALDRARVKANAAENIRNFDIRPADPELAVRALSGGNQQKVVIAREMGRDFRVLLAAQPTRGVDVGAIEFIHAQLRRAREAGRAILLVSADLNEVLALSDRIGVLYGGRLVCLLDRSEASAEILGQFMTGASGSDVPVSGARQAAP